MSKIVCVVGGQYGSEGKGAVAAALCIKHPEIGVAVRVAGPNAGHSAIDGTGRKWALRQVPVAAVVRRDLNLVLAQGSEIDFDVLVSEVKALDDAGHRVRQRLMVDASATVIDDKHKDAEAGGDITARLGSTAKGVGAARADRIWRTARTWGEIDHVYPDENDGEHYELDQTRDTADWLRRQLVNENRDVLIEGTQGYGLGLHQDAYPQTTSSDCTASDFIAMAGLNAWDATDGVDVWLAMRTYPIRVAGNSGPLFGETTWEELGDASDGYIQPERTTVTQKIRRVGIWDPKLAHASCAAHGSAAKVALTFFDYWYPTLAGETDPKALTSEHLVRIKDVATQCGAPVLLLGTGPDTVIDLR